MFKNIAKAIGGDPIKKMLDHYREMVEEINALEPGLQSLSDEALKAKTNEFKGRLQQGETVDDLLVEAFAVVREVAIRTVGLRHFDVQLVGGIVLHRGQIAEMKTGEGKTLVATMPIYLNALEHFFPTGIFKVTIIDNKPCKRITCIPITSQHVFSGLAFLLIPFEFSIADIAEYAHIVSNKPLTKNIQLEIV